MYIYIYINIHTYISVRCRLYPASRNAPQCKHTWSKTSRQEARRSIDTISDDENSDWTVYAVLLIERFGPRICGTSDTAIFYLTKYCGRKGAPWGAQWNTTCRPTTLVYHQGSGLSKDNRTLMLCRHFISPLCIELPAFSWKWWQIAISIEKCPDSERVWK